MQVQVVGELQYTQSDYYAGKFPSFTHAISAILSSYLLLCMPEAFTLCFHQKVVDKTN